MNLKSFYFSFLSTGVTAVHTLGPRPRLDVVVVKVPFKPRPSDLRHFTSPSESRVWKSQDGVRLLGYPGFKRTLC